MTQDDRDNAALCDYIDLLMRAQHLFKKRGQLAARKMDPLRVRLVGSTSDNVPANWADLLGRFADDEQMRTLVAQVMFSQSPDR
jgi:hypothetical protein